jgi:hypothetical protein
MELPFVDLSGEREETAVELADTVESLTLTYLNEDGETLSQWDSKAEETEGLLPRLVHIRLQLAGEKSRVFATTVAIQGSEIRGQEAADAGIRRHGETEKRRKDKASLVTWSWRCALC